MRVAGVEWTSEVLRVVVATARRGALVIDETRTVALADDEAVDAALAEVAAARPSAVLAALPAGAVAHRLLTLPFRSDGHLRRTVPLELRGHLPADPGAGRVGYCVLERAAGASVVLAVLARDEDVARARTRLAAAGLALRELAAAPLAVWTLVPGDDDAALLVVDGRDTTIGIRTGGRPRRWHLLSSPPDAPDELAAEVAATLTTWNQAGLRPWVAGPDASEAHRHALETALGRAAQFVPPDSRLGAEADTTLRHYLVPLALVRAAAGDASVPPLLVGDPSPRHRARRLAALVAAAVLLAVLDLGLLRWSLVGRAARFERAAVAAAAAVLPGEPIVAPRAQLETVVGRTGDHPAGTLLGRLREVASRMPAGLRVDVEELRLDDDHLRLDGRAPTYEAVDALRRALAASPRLRDVGTEDVRATVDGVHVVFRLRARWIPRGEAAS
jgi:hypothetical protein